MEAYDKPFLTYDEQIDCLIEKHGLDVSDRDFARRVLRSVSYYDLINGYKDAFMVNEKYGEHMSIEFLYSFYIFDKRFQDLLFAQILLVENTLQNWPPHAGTVRGQERKEFQHMENLQLILYQKGCDLS